jgi:hypothetical protein
MPVSIRHHAPHHPSPADSQLSAPPTATDVPQQGGRLTPSPGPVPVPVVGCVNKYTTTFNIPANKVKDGVYQLMVTINHSPQGATTPPPLSQQLTENVGFAQSVPIKVTKIVKETGTPD